MDSYKCNIILKGILGRKIFHELLDYTVDTLDEIIGDDHSVIFGIVASNVINMLIVYLGFFMADNISIKTVEKIFSDNYKVFVPQKNLYDFYIHYKKYIDIVKDYMIKNNQ